MSECRYCQGKGWVMTDSGPKPCPGLSHKAEKDG